MRDMVTEKQYYAALALGVPVISGVQQGFANLPNVSQADALDHTLQFVVRGDIGSVLKQATSYPILSMISHEQTLEEAFLEYYREDVKRDE